MLAAGPTNDVYYTHFATELANEVGGETSEVWNHQLLKTLADSQLGPEDGNAGSWWSRTIANDSKLIMQLSKKLETLLMDNEDLRDQNDRLNTRLIAAECEKMNMMA